MSPILSVIVLFLAVAFGASAHAQAPDCQPDWIPTFGCDPGFGLTGTVHALATYDDGSGSALIAGGEFFIAGGAWATRVARWTGTGWAPLAFGLNGTVYALAVFDEGDGPRLFAGGSFSFASGQPSPGIARWDGTSWSAVGGSVSGGEVNALAVHDDGRGPALYVGGRFTQAGGAPANHIARWDGRTWSAVGGGLGSSGQSVLSLTSHDDGSGPCLVAGGNFTSASGVEVRRIARWNGVAWLPLGSGMDLPVRALASVAAGPSEPAQLYAGGGFSSAGDVVAKGIAVWDGDLWSEVGSGLPNAFPYVQSLRVIERGSGHELAVGGSFANAGGVAGANFLALWNGRTWSGLGDLPSSTGVISAITQAPIAGQLTLVAASDFSSKLWTWNGGDLAPLSTGLQQSTVYAVLPFDDGSGPSIIVGGNVGLFGGAPSDGIARWDGTAWHPLGLGMDFWVMGLASFDDGRGDSLYAAGYFNYADGMLVNGIARWDGTSWHGLDGGLNGSAEDIAVWNDGTRPALYVGGLFSSAGPAAAKNVARWNGTEWSPLGSGVDGIVYCISEFDDGAGSSLVVGGTMDSAGGSPVQNIARWDGTQWSGFGSGLDGTVRALAVFDEGSGPALFAGGVFHGVDGLATTGLAKWDGQTWRNVGGGVQGEVLTLAAFDDGEERSLVVGGSFYFAAPLLTSNIVRWNGVEWFAMGAGMSGAGAEPELSNSVNALAALPATASTPAAIVAGGFFGTSPSGDSYLALWQGCAVVCAGDLDGDGAVGAPDLAIVFAAWGTPAGDLDGDGTTSAQDIAVLLGAWGECP